MNEDKLVPLLSEKATDQEIFSYIYWLCHHSIFDYSPAAVGRDGEGFDSVQWRNGRPSEESLVRLKRNHEKLKRHDWTEINAMYINSIDGREFCE